MYCFSSAILATIPLANCDSSSSVRPLIIALPIRIQSQRSSRQIIPEDTGQEESEEEQQREQRLVPRTFNPHMEPRFPQRPEENSNSNSNRNQNQSPQPFLTWNPGNKLMVLQINDVISFRKEDESESEENERTEDHPPIKPRQNWGYQGAFDFEDAGRVNSKRLNDQYIPRMPTTKKRKNSKVTSSEDSGDDVFGTDPVVHYLRSKSRKNDKHFDFSEIPDEADDEFNIREWWRY